ncbi:hypothetical protein GALMADRAFT_263859 [Galerina marginata CBS 339.88]|uniref:Anaphase-promoting complex subunit 5 n=1 Tax=Galerina marginata (strain CBS 339.88) TaxID=685588 RepID=A0A067TGV8_GALM3|nr:hypothetical protein GALMADRAFT_263859 [Galerina marginata CBS 339.88]
MEEVPPPADHVIQPHHIAVLTILMMAFKDLEIKKFPPAYALHLHRVLLNEVSEVARPKSHEELISEICARPKSDASVCSEFQTAIKSIHKDLVTVDKMGNFLGNLPCLFMTKNPDDHPRFLRRSIFGYFCRRCYVTFVKLSFAGLDKLCQDYQTWVAGDNFAGYSIIEKDDLRSDLLIYKTQADKKSWAKPNLYEAWEKNHVVGDENLAIENLRRFFEQHFHESNDSGFRPHALLNLVRLHYINEEYLAARQLLGEAINAARLSNDRVTLHHCTSILHRLPPIVEGQKPVLHEIQPDLHPHEVLFDVSKLLDPENEQPLNAAFNKIFQAIGLYDHWLDVQFALPVEEQQWAHHAVQSIVWKAAGCENLATVEENIVMAFIPPGGENANRLAIVLNKSYQTARQGNYDKALALLIDPSAWRGLILHDYGTWAMHIWHILTLRATRRGQLRLCRELLIPRRPDGPFNPKDYVYNVEWERMSTIRESLYQFLQLRQHDQATSGIEHLLQALWHSEFLCRFNLYRSAIILLADIGLEFGITRRSRQILDEIMPQVINGDDLEQRAVACFTLARCIIVAEGSTPPALREALPYLIMAESDFQKLEIYRSMKDVQYMLSIVYHNLDMVEERQEAANRHLETEALQKRLETIVSDEHILEIFDLMATVGAALASR